MPVIALTQGMGSLAQDIAEQLAAELGIATLQHEVAERVADKMHVSKSLINRLRAGKAGTIERLPQRPGRPRQGSGPRVVRVVPGRRLALAFQLDQQAVIPSRQQRVTLRQ